MKASNKNKKSHFWVISISMLCVCFSFSCNEAPNKQEEAKQDLSQIDDTQGSETSTNYQPQFSKDNPRKESVDPFTPHDDFERMLDSNKNKGDFDFTFSIKEDRLKSTSENGPIDFLLKGTFKTLADISQIPLSIVFFDNDQISFTKRVEKIAFDFPIIIEGEKKAGADKFSYQFDFTQQIQLDRGLHYFLIFPTGRNRVIYTGKFLVE